MYETEAARFSNELLHKTSYTDHQREAFAVVGIDFGQRDSHYCLDGQIRHIPTLLALDGDTAIIGEDARNHAAKSPYSDFLRFPGDRAKGCYAGDWDEPSYENLTRAFLRAFAARIWEENREKLDKKKYLVLCIGYTDSCDPASGSEERIRMLTQWLNIPGFDGKLYIMLCPRTQAAMMADQDGEPIDARNSEILFLDGSGESLRCVLSGKSEAAVHCTVAPGAPVRDSLVISAGPDPSADCVICLGTAAEDSILLREVQSSFAPRSTLVLPNLARELELWGDYMCRRNILLRTFTEKITGFPDLTNEIHNVLLKTYVDHIWEKVERGARHWKSLLHDTSYLDGVFGTRTFSHPYGSIAGNLGSLLTFSAKGSVNHKSILMDLRQFFDDDSMTYPLRILPKDIHDVIDEHIPLETVEKVYAQLRYSSYLLGFIKSMSLREHEPLPADKRKEYANAILERKDSTKSDIRNSLSIPRSASRALSETISSTLLRDLIQFLDKNAPFILAQPTACQSAEGLLE